MGIQYNVRDVGDVSVVDLSGQLTLTSMPPYDSTGTGVVISDVVHQLADRKRKRVLLNLHGVTYVDSCGIGHLVQAIAAARRASLDVKLSGATAPVFALLRMTHLEKIVDIADNEEGALKLFAKAPAPQTAAKKKK